MNRNSSGTSIRWLFIHYTHIELEFRKERGRPEYPEKNLSERGRKPTTNSTHIWRLVWESNPSHIGGKRVLSPLRQSHLTLMMSSAQGVETSVNVTSNSPSQDYTHPDDHNLPNYDMTPGLRPFTVLKLNL